MKYMHLDTGEFYSIDEIRKSFDDFACEMDGQWIDFEEYFEAMLDMGRRGIGGFIEVEE